jgi:hypothetical protein
VPTGIARLLGAAVVAAALAAPAGASPPASVALSSYRAGARPVALTVRFTTELQCGRLLGAAVSLELPRLEQVPATVRAAAVTIDGERSSHVAVAGHTLVIGLPRPHGAICTVLAVGTARIVVTRAAGIGNPRVAGTYAFAVRRSGAAQRTVVRIRS